jgi:PAS domain S-box-containing protein
MSSEAPALADLTVCETEPICFPGSVQPHGALLVVHGNSGLVAAASTSCLDLLGRAAATLIGQPLSQVLGPAAARPLLAANPDTDGVLVDVSLPGRPLVARATRNPQGQVLVDIEPGQPQSPAMQQGCRRLAATLRTLDDEQALAQAAARGIRALTGHDRVMIYRFDADWNGEVLGEDCADRLAPFLGLHYPASDIPRQARELFKLARVRVIADIDYQPAALLAEADAQSIDLGLSSLRSVSPVHIEYSRNMGVRATLVGSLVIAGKLWGLVSCHHGAGPLATPPADRDALGDLCDDLAAHIGLVRLQRRLQRQQHLATRRVQLVETIRRIDLRALLRQPAARDVLDVMAADGFAMVVGNSVYRLGHTPSEPRIRALLAPQHRRGTGPVLFASQALQADLGGSDDDGVAGAVVVGVATIPQTLLVWFRSERSRTVRWAGNPEQAHHTHADGRISPRQSFSAFLKLIRGQSLPWSAEELESATELGALIEIDALREREAFTQTILDSSPDQLCVLDPNGVIVAVNNAWRRFAMANGAGPVTLTAVGLNYRHICQAAEHQPGGAEAPDAWAGIAAVLGGRQAQFSLDYPCDSPGAPRWFQMLVCPMRPPGEGVVVLHQDITPRKQAELALQLSEQRLQAVLQDQTELICRVRTDGTILYANAAFWRFFGKSAQASGAQDWRPMIWHEDLPAVERALRTLSPAQPVVVVENRVVADNGNLRWGQFVNRGIFDAGGRMIELQAVGRDITERKAIEAELALHREHLEQLVAARTADLASAMAATEAALAELQQLHAAHMLGTQTRQAAMASMSDAVFITDSKGQVVDFNDAFVALHRFKDRSECPGTLDAYQDLLDVYLPDGALAPMAQWAAPSALRGETAVGAEFTLRRRDTGATWVSSYNYAPIRGDAGQIVGAVVTARDITRDKHAALHLRQAMEAAEAANRAKTSFLATMSHELRTPMNAILGMTDLALRRATDARQIDQLRKSQQASRHLLAIISDVLDLTRIEADKLALADEPFQLDGLMEHLSAQMHTLLADRPLVCTVQLDPTLRGMRLRGDATRLLQVLLNLGGNAVKFTAQGSVQVNALLEQDSPTWAALRFEVRDTGIGIAPGDLDRVFQPFVQVDSSMTRQRGGTGLGLSVCRQLVRLMDGQIGVHSVPGTGSTFWFSVRLAKSDHPAAALPTISADALRQALRARHAGACVLLAEDDALNREITQMQLEECGLQVHVATNGHEAAALALRLPCDLVLMDVQMPEMNGLDAARLIRQQATGRRVPVVALTANVFDDDKTRCHAAGMDDFIGRPAEPEVLLDTVLRWLDSSRA